MTEIYPIAPAGKGALYLMVPIVLLLAFLLVALVAFTVSAGKGSVEVTAEALRVKAPFYGRSVPRTALRLDGAKVVDFASERELRPKWRTNGIGLPGYACGWFRLRNGEKALLLVTDRRKVLYLPTAEGYSLLVSAAEPERLLGVLKGGP